ncbi:MAG: orotidine-5'-phosphate decarboxylase [Actinomycetota bacterium]
MPNFGQRLRGAFDRYGHLCVGIDPTPDQLANWGLEFSAKGAGDFAYRIIDAAQDCIGIIKPQVAFFEQFGSKGFQVLEAILERASESELLVIADAKRGDIGSTMNGYSAAWLSKDAVFQADALTISPFLGPESLNEVVSIANQSGRGIFLLAATSNPEAKTLQMSTNSGLTVARQICDYAAKNNAADLGSIGVVIGANVRVEDFGIAEENLKSTPILAPGFGFQGAELQSVVSTFGSNSQNVICNVSRSITSYSKDSIVSRIENAKLELVEGMTK